ncbi:hypothetical protein PCE1_004186 [Barthelona sp. PCE]
MTTDYLLESQESGDENYLLLESDMDSNQSEEVDEIVNDYSDSFTWSIFLYTMVLLFFLIVVVTISSVVRTPGTWTCSYEKAENFDIIYDFKSPNSDGSFSYINDCVSDAVFLYPSLLCYFLFLVSWLMGTKPWRFVNVSALTKRYGVHRSPGQTLIFSLRLLLCIICLFSSDFKLIFSLFQGTGSNQDKVESTWFIISSYCRLFSYISLFLVFVLCFMKGVKTPKFTTFFLFSNLFYSVVIEAKYFFVYTNFNVFDSEMFVWQIFFVGALAIAVVSFITMKKPHLEKVDLPNSIDIEAPISMMNLKNIAFLIKNSHMAVIVGCALAFFQGMSTIWSYSLLGQLMSGTVATDRSSVNSIAMEFILSCIVTSSLIGASKYCFTLSGLALTVNLKEKVFESILNQDPQFLFDKSNSVSQLANRLACVDFLGRSISTNVPMTITPLVETITSVITLFGLSWQLSTIMFGMVIYVIAFACLRAFVIVARFSQKYFAAKEAETSKTSEVVACLDTVRLYGEEGREKKKLFGLVDNTYQVGFSFGFLDGICESIENLLMSSINGAIMWYGSLLLIESVSSDNTDFSASVISQFAILASNVIGSFAALVSLFPQLAALAGPFQLVFEMVNMKPKVDVYEGRELPHFMGHITFDEVTFAYPSLDSDDELKPVLRDLSLDIAPGLSIAFCGSSGSGKSSALSLIQNFYWIDKKEDSGTLFIDGVDIRELKPAYFYKKVGVVTQKPIIFNDTIKYNLLYGCEDPDAVSEEDIWEAVRDAGCADFITPESIDNPCGEGGAFLSGGQRQRLSIARVLLRKPKILILDEPTSALDPESEAMVTETLQEIDKDTSRTVIAVAHRLNTIAHSDQLFVLHQGKLIEKGTHNQLVKKAGFYNDLFQTQVKVFREFARQDNEEEE